MPCHLVDLSPELQLEIVNELLKDTKVSEGEIEESKKQQNPYNYNSEKTDETKRRIKWEHKKNRLLDLMNWSCTSRFFRDFLAPYIFEIVKLCNTEERGSAVTALSKSKLNKHVKELHYVGSAPGDAHRDEEEWSDTAAILPNGVDTLLSDLRCFPSLDTLSVEFPYHFADSDEWDQGLDLCAKEETDEDVNSAEDGIAWRALMAKTWEALSKNKGFHLKHLEIRQLGPKKVSTFTNAAFHDFLGRVERFSLSLYGEDNGACWKINTVPDYEAFVTKLDRYFFEHLGSVTELVLKAPEEGPLGLEGANHFPLSFKESQMPALKTLYLEYIFVGQDLIDFLVGHSKTLESLSLRNCSASVNGLADNGITWKQFFDPLHDANFQKLRQLVIEPDRVPLTFEDTHEKEEDEAKVPAEVKEVHQILENDPSRRLFAYTTLDDKYGMIFEDEEENVAAFQRGEDQASYEKLMSQVEANVQKVSEK